jgi:hypothetical protein
LGAPLASQVMASSSGFSSTPAFFGSFPMSNYTSAEIALSRDIINYFSNFAKYG